MKKFVILDTDLLAESCGKIAGTQGSAEKGMKGRYQCDGT
jgi:hypothetical protein